MKKIKLDQISVQRIVIFIIVILSVVYFRYNWIRNKNEQTDDLLRIARTIEVTLPMEDLKALEAKPGDIGKPQYLIIKDKLKAIIRVNTDARFVYIYTERNGKIYFIADSKPEDSKDYSPPGKEFTEAKSEDKKPFSDGKVIIVVSKCDRWGTWTSALIPI